MRGFPFRLFCVDGMQVFHFLLAGYTCAMLFRVSASSDIAIFSCLVS